MARGSAWAMNSSQRLLVSIILFAGVENAQLTRTGDGCQNLQPDSVLASLVDTCRPRPVSPAEKDLILRSLPAKGELRKLKPAEQRKMAALDPVLGAHGREGVYQLKVIDLPVAATALHGRAVLLVTLPALHLLSESELQALAAHEIGHEYVWQEFVLAKQRNDTARLRELELVCDIVAAETLRRLGVPGERLPAALEKVFRYNHEHFGIALNEGAYPRISERRAIISGLGISAPSGKLR